MITTIVNSYTDIATTQRQPTMVVGGAYDKRQVIEEPDEAKVSRPVLKTNGIGDNFIEFNTSQMQLCQAWLQSLGVSVVLTREPGGTELGLDLRRLLLEKADHKPIAELTELLLYAADRAQHVEQEIKPYLAQGKYILCDRYVESTIAYQGYGRRLNMSLIDQLNYIATGGLQSHLTIWLDVDVEVGLARKRGTEAALDRIEQETIAFHQRVQQGYADLAAAFPERIIRIDGSFSKEIVHQTIQGILRDRLLLG